MPSPLSLTLGLQSGCAKWAVAYFAPCGAFLRFHVLLLSQSAQQLALWAWCLQGEKSLARTEALKGLFRDYKNPDVHETTPENRGFYCALGLIRLVFKRRPLPASIWLSQVCMALLLTMRLSFIFLGHHKYYILFKFHLLVQTQPLCPRPAAEPQQHAAYRITPKCLQIWER